MPNFHPDLIISQDSIAIVLKNVKLSRTLCDALKKNRSNQTKTSPSVGAAFV